MAAGPEPPHGKKDAPRARRGSEPTAASGHPGRVAAYPGQRPSRPLTLQRSGGAGCYAAAWPGAQQEHPRRRPAHWLLAGSAAGPSRGGAPGGGRGARGCGRVELLLRSSGIRPCLGAEPRPPSSPLHAFLLAFPSVQTLGCTQAKPSRSRLSFSLSGTTDVSSDTWFCMKTGQSVSDKKHSEQIIPVISKVRGSVCQRWGIFRTKRSSAAFANAKFHAVSELTEYHFPWK